MTTIELTGNVSLDFEGRKVTVCFFDPATDNDYIHSLDLDAVQTGEILGQLLSTMEIITPDSIVGGWLQQAFNSGLTQGRAEESE
jgi:hypothetical protein